MDNDAKAPVQPSGPPMHLRVAYDPPVDVLYVILDATPYEGDGLERGIELDYSLLTGAPSGAKVIGYRKNGWPRDLDVLAGIVANHLSVDASPLAKRIAEAVEGGNDART